MRQMHAHTEIQTKGQTNTDRHRHADTIPDGGMPGRKPGGMGMPGRGGGPLGPPGLMPIGGPPIGGMGGRLPGGIPGCMPGCGVMDDVDGAPTPRAGPLRPTGGALMGATMPRPAARPAPGPGAATLTVRFSCPDNKRLAKQKGKGGVRTHLGGVEQH